MDRLSETVRQFLIHNNLTREDGQLLVAVSGGPDSVCLLDILVQLTEPLGLKLAVAHLNHNLRGEESDQEAHFVRELAESKKLECFTDTLKPEILKSGKGSLQENARRERYQFLNRTLKQWGGNAIALGHHLDDQAETVLMNFLRGSGLRGLSGMSPLRGNLVRPFLGVSRQDILSYIDRHRIKACEDSSNYKKEYLRNRVRADLIPLLLRDYNPNWKQHLADIAPLFQEEDAYLEKTAVDLMDKELLIKSDVTQLCLSRRAFKQVPSALQYRMVRESYRRLQGHLRLLNWNHVRNAVALACQDKQQGQIDLPGNLHMQVDAQQILFRKKISELARPEFPSELEFSLKIPGKIKIYRSMEFETQIFVSEFPDWHQLEPHQALFDLDKTGLDLKIRFFRNGDRFSPLGMKGSKKLKAFFIDRKIPRDKRRCLPLLTTASGDIIWVWREQMSEKYRVNPETQRVCLITGMGNPFPDSAG